MCISFKLYIYNKHYADLLLQMLIQGGMNLKAVRRGKLMDAR